jgi:superfamily II DNA or RNA helicase
MFEERAYQTEAAAWLASRRRGIVQIPAGGGKSRMAAMALDMVLKKKQRIEKVKIGWLAPSIETRDQGIAAMIQFPLVAEQDIKASCVFPGVDFSDRDILIVDECKHATAPVWCSIVNQCQNRWGLDATPFFNDEERDTALLALFDNQIHTVERRVLSDKLSPARVQFLDATDDGLRPKIDADITATMQWRRRFWSGDEGQLWGQVAWQSIIKLGIVNNAARNRAAVAAALRHSEPTLILVNQVEHALWFAEQLPGAVACYAKMGKKRREQAMADFKAGKVRRLVATSLADEGLDLPQAAVLVLVSAGKSETKTVQRTGRVLRRHEGKGDAIIYDFVDEYHPLAAKHSRRRRDIYLGLGYKINLALK